MLRVPTLLIALALAASPLQAEVLLLDAIAEEPPNDQAGLPRPSPGNDMWDVERRFGKPESTHGPIGDPAISRWDYPGYSVYFERATVLTSVVHR